MKLRFFAVRALLPSLLVLAPVACRIEPGAFDDDFEGADGRVEYTWNREGRLLRAVAAGELAFNADDSGLTSISGDGYFSVEEEADGTTRKWEATPGPSGEITSTYTVDGSPRPGDEDGNQWLARTLPQVLRESGLDAEARTRRILEASGVEGVLAEIALIDSDRAREIYVRELVSGPELSEEQLARIARLVRRTGSSAELARLVQLLAERRPGSFALTDELIESLRGIGSSSLRRQAIDAILQRRDLNETTAVALADAVAGIRADSEKAGALLALAEKSPKSAKTAAAFVDAVSTIRSSSEKGRALRVLIPKPGVDAAVQARIARTVIGIHSSSEKAAALSALAEILKTGEDATLEAFLEATATIDDPSEQERVLSAFLARNDLNSDTLRKTLAFVSQQVREGPSKERLVDRLQRKLKP